MKNILVTPGVIVERVGDDLMVIVPGNTDVVTLSGRVANVLLDVKAGKTIDSNDPAVHDLIKLSVLTAPGMSRRDLIRAGAIGTGAGIAMLSMPGVAAASSECLDAGIGTYKVQLIATIVGGQLVNLEEVRFQLATPNNNPIPSDSDRSVLTLTTGEIANPLGGTTLDGTNFLVWRIPNSSWAYGDGDVSGQFTFNEICYQATFKFETEIP